MASIRTGGDPEEYMQAPSLGSGGGSDSGGAGSFIANVLDLLGIHRQVAKGPKKAKGEAGSQDFPPAEIAPPPNVPVASGVDNLFSMVDSVTGIPSRSADMNNSFTAIDPDAALRLPKLSK